METKHLFALVIGLGLWAAATWAIPDRASFERAWASRPRSGPASLARSPSGSIQVAYFGADG